MLKRKFELIFYILILSVFPLIVAIFLNSQNIEEKGDDNEEIVALKLETLLSVMKKFYENRELGVKDLSRISLIIGNDDFYLDEDGENLLEEKVIESEIENKRKKSVKYI